MTKHDERLSAKGLPTMRTLVSRIIRTFNEATDGDLEAGARWYDEAHGVARDLVALDPSNVSLEAACAVIAHLSPRTSWARNVSGAVSLVSHGEAPGCMARNISNAQDALAYSNPFESFGPTALKTRAFAANIFGDEEAVTVDVWAARVVGLTEVEIGWVGIYDAVAHAYRLAARRVGVSPRTMQATTWIVARGGRAA